ncbi:hypothetical protein [Eleftheria terrae]|uniref:hypothetical protein n=1 Tax=Eleftheria terrae TaxID=1597781 RepID=UPI00263AB5DB|nr:hypothetical protein [Eleftheria terrae]WKB50639.1 hypothetical protein N7L95_12430 [Eleftheria terrae]
MFIVWGRKLVRRGLGYVADFCPICRVIQPFKLERLGSVGHVYYLSFGQGELVGYERTCQACKTSFNAEPSVYAGAVKTVVPLPELQQRTFPHLATVLRERLELEAKVKRDPTLLSGEERYALIRNTFELLSPKVEKRFAATHIDKEVALAAGGALALTAVGPGVVRSVYPDAAELSLLVFMGLGALLLVWQFALSGRRFMRRDVIPTLAMSLHPLRPSERELTSVLQDLKQLRHKIASKLKLSDLQMQLRQGPAGHSAP